MVKKIRYPLVVLMLILLVGLVFASFEVGDVSHSIDNIYGGSENIQGWINISLNDESTDSLFEDSRSNSIELLELIQENTNYDYSCSPEDCYSDYTATSGETSKTFDLDVDDSILFGLSFTGTLITVNSVNFKLQSDALEACESQIKIDILDDGVIDFSNNKTAIGTGCSNLRKSGCYSSAEDSEEYIITETPYCQKINLSESPAFTLGAWVKKVSGSKILSMSLYDKIGNDVASCELPDASTSGGEISCLVNHPATEQEEYYVCISSTEGTSGDVYKIKGYSTSEGCGFRGFPLQSNTPAAYYIFAEGKKFGAVGTIPILNSLDDGSTFGNIVHDYILERYGGFDCSAGCVVPIRFSSAIGQQITIDDLSINYEKESGVLIENRFYSLTEVPAKITADFQKLYLDEGDFSVPEGLGSYYFSLDLNNEEVFSEEVEVKDIPKIISLEPLSTASAHIVEFTVNIDSSRDITRYSWEFGDSGTAITTTNKTTHIYSAIGKYELTITVTDSGGFTASKTFDIDVVSPRDLINTTLEKLEENIDNIEVQILELNLFTQESLNSILEIDNAKSELVRLDAAFNSADSEEKYNLILTDLEDLKIPESITKTINAESIFFFPDEEDIEVDILQTIGGGEYDSEREDDYIDAIISWNHGNIEIRVDFIEYSGTYEDSVEPILNIFEIDISEKTSIDYGYYLILPELENLEFKTGVIKRDADGYVYVDLGGGDVISFSTTASVDFTTLPAFISPGISRLSVTTSDEEEDEKPKTLIFILVIFLLVLVGVIAYVVLQQWYKRKYEKYLFKNKNDIYNMAHYVNRAKKKGLRKSEIAGHLKRSKWSGEQVRYIMKKYGGKRTGMVELPVSKLLKLIKNKQQESDRKLR